MEEKSINISIPEGYEIDKEKSTFTKIVFKKIENKLPMSFEEIKIPEYYSIHHKIHHITCNPTIGENFTSTVYPTKEYAEAFWALSKLIWLRDAWNEGWMPNLKEEIVKFVIVNQEDRLEPKRGCFFNYIMCFKESETRDNFLIQFKDLLETAKPLL